MSAGQVFNYIMATILVVVMASLGAIAVAVAIAVLRTVLYG